MFYRNNWINTIYVKKLWKLTITIFWHFPIDYDFILHTFRSPEWRLISESRRREIGLTFDNDGEFWMSYKDFKANFGTIQICHLNPHLICQSSNLMNSRRKWKLSLFDGEWVRGVTAGGNINNRCNKVSSKIILTWLLFHLLRNRWLCLHVWAWILSKTLHVFVFIELELQFKLMLITITY